MLNCECENWARTGNQKLNTKHHAHCEHYWPEQDAYEIISDLIDGIIVWAADEDGVHENCWNAFQNAAAFIGRFDLIKSDNHSVL